MTTKRLLPLAIVAACLAASVACVASAAVRKRPAVNNFSFSPSTFAVTTSPSASAASAGRGTMIRFNLAGAGTMRVRIAIAHRLSGRKLGGRCVAAKARLRRRPACTRYRSMGSITRGKLGAGDNSVLFSGRVGGHRLVPGKYRATLVAVGRHGVRSKHARATFSVIRSAPAASPPAPAPPAPAPPAVIRGYPNPTNTGVPAGWTPRHTTNGDMTVTTNGAVIDGELVTGSISVRAQNVTIRNSWVYGEINNQASNAAYNGLLIQDTDVGPPTGVGSESAGAIGVGGYTALRVHIHNVQEGFRVGGYNTSGKQLGGVTIQDSLVQLVRGSCSHNDGIQGFDEPPRLILNHNTIDARDAGASCTTGATFIGNDNPDTITVTNNLLGGGGFTMRLGGPGSDGPGGTYDHVSGNRIINGGWGSGPVLVDSCPNPPPIADWSDNTVVTIDGNYQPTSTVRKITNIC
jgi:hypothetical protein